LSLGFNGIKHFFFYDLGETYSTEKPLRDSEIVFSAEIFLDDTIIKLTRKSYGILDLLGDVGGEI
jgi:hypothetical protein